MKVSERADVAVLGPGRCGEHAAGALAESWPEVVGAGAEPVGGECPYRGGVPGAMTVRAGRAALIGATSAGRAGGEVLCGLDVTSARPAGSEVPCGLDVTSARPAGSEVPCGLDVTSARPAAGEVPCGLDVAVHAEAAVERLRRTIRAFPAFPAFHRTVGAAPGALR
ncbi:hypothetical protein ACWER6_10580 [Streptomyces sp. NPDC004009]